MVSPGFRKPQWVRPAADPGCVCVFMLCPPCVCVQTCGCACFCCSGCVCGCSSFVSMCVRMCRHVPPKCMCCSGYVYLCVCAPLCVCAHMCADTYPLGTCVHSPRCVCVCTCMWAPPRACVHACGHMPPQVCACAFCPESVWCVCVHAPPGVCVYVCMCSTRCVYVCVPRLRVCACVFLLPRVCVFVCMRACVRAPPGVCIDRTGAALTQVHSPPLSQPQGFVPRTCRVCAFLSGRDVGGRLDCVQVCVSRGQARRQHRPCSLPL